MEQKKVEQTPTVVEEKVKEFNPFGLNDVLHYIKRETGVDLFQKTRLLKQNSNFFVSASRLIVFENFLKRFNTTKSLDKT